MMRHDEVEGESIRQDQQLDELVAKELRAVKRWRVIQQQRRDLEARIFGRKG